MGRALRREGSSVTAGEREHTPATQVHSHLEGSGAGEPTLPGSQGSHKRCSPPPCQGGSLGSFSGRGAKRQPCVFRKIPVGSWKWTRWLGGGCSLTSSREKVSGPGSSHDPSHCTSPAFCAEVQGQCNVALGCIRPFFPILFQKEAKWRNWTFSAPRTWG